MKIVLKRNTPKLKKATPSNKISNGEFKTRESEETTHFSITDKYEIFYAVLSNQIHDSKLLTRVDYIINNNNELLVPQIIRIDKILSHI